MAEPFLAQIQIFGFGFAPRGWATCSGQILPIAQNQALFSILGTTYGGNGVTTFGLPDLRSRTPMHWGQGPGLSNRVLGQVGGVESVTLNTNQIPNHTHSVTANTAAPTVGTPAGNLWAQGKYSTTGGSLMAAGAIGNSGSSQPHPNLSPYLTLNICIALVGVFPSRN